jgi:hypothetical protein
VPFEPLTRFACPAGPDAAGKVSNREQRFPQVRSAVLDPVRNDRERANVIGAVADSLDVSPATAARLIDRAREAGHLSERNT